MGNLKKGKKKSMIESRMTKIQPPMIAVGWNGNAIAGSGNEPSERRLVFIKPIMSIGNILIILAIVAPACKGIVQKPREVH
jgi:hypothetical protein